MSQIRWREEFSVGNHALDQEHQIIVEIINELDRALGSDDKRDEVVTEVLTKLTYYVSKHFYHEEHILRAAEYPELKDHIVQHVYFKRALADYDILVMQKQQLIGYKLLEFLHVWWSDHILKEDKLYKNFLESKGQVNGGSTTAS